MKLSSKGRYAVMALADLAKFDANEPVSLRDISLRQGISLLYLEQLFLKLKKNKIVKSVRGNKGGYILNRNASEIEQKITPTSFNLSLKVVATETESNTAYTAIPFNLCSSCNGMPSFL